MQIFLKTPLQLRLEGLNKLGDHLRTEKHTPRNGEIRNIQTSLILAISNLESFDAIDEIKGVVGDAMNRLEHLVENPESAGKHGEIIETLHKSAISTP